ncbi:nucleotidyl transferase AbiEii/AbiGii toxin family protein [Flavobacterium macacae]|uniref:Nucleotidyl transferase AbiEii/AbiGii toxin family protein n=1 Tax=Flavobacterium macacae TaxID=2488993 RepID=A0A3P3WEW1_9FLAO|nr:nucleotidyl transferase AbiEii/AbiGii toxin family protein [Flavobacterium macacae]RRJ92907.1 hypothetical protein EG849_04780 [Flavobacterium macacae]
MLHKETVSAEMWELLQKLMKDEKLKDYFLVGGTALALRLGHRLSVDIDLFTTKDFDSKEMFKYLKEAYRAELIEDGLSNNTVLAFIGNIKVDVLTHNYPLVAPLEYNDGIRMVSNQDIGAMKLHAIHQSGERYKDFVDMAFLLEHAPLKNYLDSYHQKYKQDPYWACIGLKTYDRIESIKGVGILKGKGKSFNEIKAILEKALKNPLEQATLQRQKEVPKTNKRRGFRR